MSGITLDMVSIDRGEAERARKGTNAVHYMLAAPVMIGSFDVRTVCGQTLGSSRDAEIETGIGTPGPLCKRCAAIFGRLVESAREAGTLADSGLNEGDDAEPVRVEASMVDLALDVMADMAAPVSESGTPESVVPGDVSESTPGNTDRVAAALAAARVKVAAQEDAEPTRTERVTEWKSKRRAAKEAAVAKERARLADVKERRAAKPLNADAIRVAAERHAVATGFDGMNDAQISALLSNTPTPKAVAAEAERATESKTITETRAAQVKEIARTTDGKCAAEVTDVNGEPLVITLSGRMLMEHAVAVAESVKGGSVVPVGKSAGALAPRAGSESLDVGANDTGVCPVCHTLVRLTGSGAIGTHRPSGDTPSGPMLTQRSVPVINDKGETPRDGEKRRDAEAYVTELAVTVDDMAPAAEIVAAVMAAVTGDADAPGVKEVRTAVVPVAESGRAPVGVRDHGRGDGVAMLPLGTTGYAGVKFDDGGTFDLDGKAADAPGVIVSDIKGGWFGHLTEAEYAQLSKAGKRTYRRTVAERKAKWLEGKERARARKILKGESLPPIERRERRAAVKIGSRNVGQTHSHHVDARPQDITVYGADGAARIGRDHV